MEVWRKSGIFAKFFLDRFIEIISSQMKSAKEQLLRIQEKLNDLIDSDATQEDAIRSVNKILYDMDPNIQFDINWIRQNMQCAIQPTTSQRELLETYNKTMQMIQHVKDYYDFPDPEAERRLMFPDGLNDPDYEL